jgi:hypothetical protein
MANEFTASSGLQEPATAQIGDLDRSFLPSVDLTRLTPAEIVAVNRYSAENNGMGDPYSDAIFSALEELPDHDPVKGLTVFELMAASASPRDRSDAALCISGLIKVDHDNGIRLFDRLLRDSELTVRSSASTALDHVVLGQDDNDEEVAERMQQRTEWGISAAEVERLRLARDQAERGENRFQLGAVALQKLLDGADQPSAPASS